MIKKSQRIKTIVEIKAAQEKNSLEALGASQRKLLATQAQIESLRKYRQEYQAKFNQQGGTGISVVQLLEFRSFMDKLDKAIAGQEHALGECETDLMTKRKNLGRTASPDAKPAKSLQFCAVCRAKAGKQARTVGAG
jgi:flagellar FliJ protein